MKKVNLKIINYLKIVFMSVFLTTLYFILNYQSIFYKTPGHYDTKYIESAGCKNGICVNPPWIEEKVVFKWEVLFIFFILSIVISCSVNFISKRLKTQRRDNGKSTKI